MEDEEVFFRQPLPPPEEPRAERPALFSIFSDSDTDSSDSESSNETLAIGLIPMPPGDSTVSSSDDIMLVDDDDDDDGEGVTPKYDWSQMPDVVVVQLLSFLDDDDRGSLARTCRRWSLLFHDPSLWRERFFQFGGGRSSRHEQVRVMGFARTHGLHLQQLHVYCLQPTFYTCKRFLRTMEDFFCILNRTRYGQCILQEFHIPQLQVERHWRYQNLRSKMLHTVTRFLRHQPQLGNVNLEGAQLPVLPGLALLEALMRGSGRALHTLNMENCFHPRVSPFRLPRFRTLMSGFKNLTTLFTNYNYLSNDVISSIAAASGKTLKHLSIKICKLDPYFHRISGDTWREFRKLSPLTQVSVDIECIGDFAEISRLLNRDMPLVNLHMWSGVPGLDETFRYDQTLLNLSHWFPERLEELSMVLENSREPVDAALLTCLQRCRRLRALDLQAVLEVSTVETIYRLREEDKLALQRCHMTLENLTGIEVIELDTLNDLYGDMAEERGLDFQIEPSEMPVY